MALLESLAASDRRHDGPERRPRLRLKRKGPITGYVDGAWWPRSDDLTSELPDLLAVLLVRLGDVARVMYVLDEWVKAPRKLRIGGRLVRLDGYHRQPSNTVEVQDARGTRIVLLVVPPQTNPDDAHNIAMAASTTDNSSSGRAPRYEGP
jgi:hypothetical protein